MLFPPSRSFAEPFYYGFMLKIIILRKIDSVSRDIKLISKKIASGKTSAGNEKGGT